MGPSSGGRDLSPKLPAVATRLRVLSDQTPPRPIRAQTIRAILFASAARTSIGGFRAIIPRSQVPGRALE